MTPKALILVGAGGAGAEALWLARRLRAAGRAEGWTVVGFADDNAALAGQTVGGARVLGSSVQVIREYAGRGAGFHCAIGSNLARERVAAQWESAGFTPVTLIDPAALVADSASIGSGCYVGAHAIVSERAQIGRHVILNFAAMVGHDGLVGDFAQLCPGARMNGQCGAGVASFLGANAVLAPGKKMGARSVLGGASFLTDDLQDGATALGVPARVVFAKR